MGTLYVGTSGWSYPTWKPGFYPAKWPAKRFLEHYATRLNSVEVNYTFRALPTETQLAGWLAAVTPGFHFSFKAPEIITHRKRLNDCGDAVDRFLTALAPIRAANALGCLLFQLPPNFKADIPRLEAFLALPQMQNAGRVCFEFRNESWFADPTWDVLRRYNAAVCIAESDDLKTPEVQTAQGFSCYRLRMPGGYDEAMLQQHAQRFCSLTGDRDVFVYYKHEDDPSGPLCAEAVRKAAAV